jgi:hypothetical protein
MGRPLLQQDQVPGTVFAGPRLWDSSRLHPDRYQLRIPTTARSGLYWPLVGLYSFKTLQRLPIQDAATGQSLADLRLPPIKIIGRQDFRPQHLTDARLGDAAALIGYDLALPVEGLHAGESLPVTLYYRSLALTSTSYTRFLHFYNVELGMAAQQDGLPQDGSNPTWAWVPGEVIADRMVLATDPTAGPGVYRLQTGLYDTQAGGARLPAWDAQHRALPDAQVDLGGFEVKR